MSIRIGKGKAAIEISGFEADMFEMELRAAMGPIIERMEEKADSIIEKAKETWPIKTGASKVGLYKQLTIVDDRILEVSILNKEPYVKFIKSTKVGTKNNMVRIRQPVKEEIGKPVKIAQKELKAELPALLESFLKEI